MGVVAVGEPGFGGGVVVGDESAGVKLGVRVAEGVGDGTGGVAVGRGARIIGGAGESSAVSTDCIAMPSAAPCACNWTRSPLDE